MWGSTVKLNDQYYQALKLVGLLSCTVNWLHHGHDTVEYNRLVHAALGTSALPAVLAPET
jgi:hypothetical protein